MVSRDLGDTAAQRARRNGYQYQLESTITATHREDASAWTSGGDCRLRVLRGGNFTSPATAIRSAARFRYDVDVRYWVATAFATRGESCRDAACT